MIVIGLGKKTKKLINSFNVQSKFLYEQDSATPEEFEKEFNITSFKKTIKKFKESEAEALLVLHSSEPISSVALVAIEALIGLEYKVDVLLLKDDISLKPKLNKMLDRLIYGVLQQKAGRSYNNLMLFDMFIVDDLIASSVSISEYQEAISNFISMSINWFYYTKQAEPIISSLNKKHDVANILTLGRMDLETGEEVIFFNLKFPRQKDYHFFLNKSDLEKPGMIKDIKKMVLGDNHMNAGFGIYSYGSSDDKEELSSFAQYAIYSSYTWDAQEVEDGV